LLLVEYGREERVLKCRLRGITKNKNKNEMRKCLMGARYPYASQSLKYFSGLDKIFYKVIGIWVI
jgi:hypothetical protein